jgi:molybdopterin molybdotransferase
VTKIYPLVKDSFADTQAILMQAFDECDLVVTSGGVSVGDTDYIKLAFEKLGGALDFWKVNMRPGRPFVFGQWRGKFLFGLPGNPVSAFVTFLVLARPALRKWQGAKATGLPAHPGTLAEALANPNDRRHLMRVTADEGGRVRSAGSQASHIMASLAVANGLVDVPPMTTLPVGATVTVMRWE